MRDLVKCAGGYCLQGTSEQLTIVRNDLRGWSVAFRGGLAVSRPGEFGQSMFRLRRTAEAFANYVADLLTLERLEGFRYEGERRCNPTADERHAITTELERLLRSER